jgi:sialate O-acetylesterase
MIHPLLKFNIKGALWYQGESNAIQGNAEKYKCRFPEMIKDWRNKFGVGNFHFYFVQLAAYHGVDFTELRWAQTWALTLVNTGMATAVDLGDPGGDIHPSKSYTSTH